MWELVKKDSQYLVFSGIPQLRIYFTTRDSGGILRKIGIENIALLRQVHSREVILVNESQWKKGTGDGMITDKRGLFLCVSVLDCVPLYLFDINNKVIALLHMGWRGSYLGILERCISKMKSIFGIDIHNISATFGPCISREFYIVNPLFKDYFPGFVTEKKGEAYLDLVGYIREKLLSAGIKEENITLPPFCTYKERELFFSFRRDRGIEGCMYALMSLM